MPHKFNADRRDKMPKQKRWVTNWAEYDESLRRRGDVTVWVSDNALALCSAPPRTTPGGQGLYSNLAIELCLTRGMVFKQPLRQTEGLMRSIAKLLGVDITVPHFTTMSRRGNGLSLSAKAASKSANALHLVVDSTGLKTFGEGEWLEKKHKTKCRRRSWRKLHLGLGLGLVSGQIVCSELTTDDIGDPTALSALLEQIDAPVDLFLADGAYDGEPTFDLLTERFGSAIKVTTPPQKNAVLTPGAAQNPNIRDSRLCCTKRVRDSCRESSVVASLHEQTDITYLQDHELGCLQRGAEALRVTDDLVRSRDELACQTVRQEGQIADVQRRRDPDVPHHESPVRDGASPDDWVCGKPPAVDGAGLGRA